MRKDDALKGEFNTALANLKASGKYDELVAKYFAITGSASIPDNAPTPADTPAPAGDTEPVSEPADANASETVEPTKK